VHLGEPLWNVTVIKNARILQIRNLGPMRRRDRKTFTRVMPGNELSLRRRDMARRRRSCSLAYERSLEIEQFEHQDCRTASLTRLHGERRIGRSQPFDGSAGRAI
jgi:hypothetical protein